MTSYSLDVWRLPAGLVALRPDAAARLDRVNAQVWAQFDPALLELVRQRICWLLGSGLSARPAETDAECAAIEFVEQLVMDVSGTTQPQLVALAAAVGHEGLRDFVTAVFVIEFTVRLQGVATALLPAADAARSRARPEGGELKTLLDEYQAAVVRGQALDPILTELVRLRCARTHHCRICQTLRLADARDAGADDAMTSKIDFYERSDLPERAKIALRITDALIGRPDELSSQTVVRAKAHFTDEQLAELCLDIVKWSTQKIHVALGTDGAEKLPTNDAGVALLRFNDDGSAAGYRAS